MSVRLGKIIVAAAGVLLMGGLIAACSGTEGDAAPADKDAAQGGTTVNVVMEETWEKWGFALDPAEVPAGKVTLDVINDGKFTHELMIYPPQDLSALVEEMVQAAWSGDASGADEPAGHDDGGADEPAGHDDGGADEPAGHDDGGADEPAGNDGGGADAGHDEAIEGLVKDVNGQGELVLEPNESATITVELTPGTYELGCLIVETVGEETFNHYDKGMHAILTVN